nr:cobalamin-dependent protein [Acidobacteriota bacterium]
MTERKDILLLVPFEHGEGLLTDAATRQTLGGHLFGPISVALSQLEEYVGFHLNLAKESERPVFGNQRLALARHRSLTAVTLATHLERAGLNWTVLDPGPEGLQWWRVRLGKYRNLRPRAIGLSTTYIMSSTSVRVLLAMIRDAFPGVPIILGGYYYATDTKDFLSMDADIFVIGEGDVRIPLIVDAIKHGKRMESIPGLYLRNGTGLRYTGPVEPLNLAQLPPVNWVLSDRIDPPVDIEHDMLEVGLETQRGCVFKCGFCTFRTLTSPNVMSTEVAVERILNMGSIRYATIMMTDATATFPHERWNEIMRVLIERGGAPHPIWAYARVSDLPEETVELMARAGVKQVFIGQESGDQV